MSVRYSIAKTGLKLSGYKKIFGLPQDELVKKAEGYNKNRDFRLPRDHKFIYGDVPVCGGKYHCLTIQKSRTRTKRAILFFFGGGMLIGPDRGDVATAAAFGKDCGMDVWFPYYPLCTNHCITDTYEMAFDTGPVDKVIIPEQILANTAHQRRRKQKKRGLNHPL